MIVEIRPLMEEDGDVVWCSFEQAAAFAVMLNDGKQDEEALWLADFANHTDAVNWAEEVAECNDAKLVDHSYPTLEHTH